MAFRSRGERAQRVLLGKGPLAFVIVTLALSGCGESEVEKAEREYRLIEKTPLAEDQLCEAAIKVRDAHLRAGNEKDYELWTIFAQTDCA